MVVAKKTLSKVKKLKVKLHKENSKSSVIKKEESREKKQIEEQKQEEKKQEPTQEQKISDFHETILEQDIGFSAPVIIEEKKEEEEPIQNILTSETTTSSLESTASQVFLPTNNQNRQNLPYASANNTYSSSTATGGY